MSARSGNWPPWALSTRRPTCCSGAAGRGQDPPGRGPGTGRPGAGVLGVFHLGPPHDPALTATYQENRLRRRLRLYLAPKVLIIDEIGYEAFPPAAATLFFKVVSARYEKASIILALTSPSASGATSWAIRWWRRPSWTGSSTTPMWSTIRGESYRLRERKASGLYLGPGLRVPSPGLQTPPLGEHKMVLIGRRSTSN